MPKAGDTLAAVRFKPPRLGEIVAGASGALLLGSLFLPWYREKSDSCPGPGGSGCPDPAAAGTAWQAFSVLDLFLLVAALAGIGLLVAQMTQRTPAIPVAWAALTTPVGTAAAVWTLVRTLDPPSAQVEPLFALLGLAAAAGIAIGCCLSMRDEGFGLRPRAGIDATLRGALGERGPEPIPAPSGRDAPRRGER